MKANGIEYKCGNGVIVNVENDLPQVGYIQDIYIVNENQITVRVKTFLQHLNHIIEDTYCSRRRICFT